MAILGWIFFGLAGIWYVAAMRYSQTRRGHLQNYILFLLLDDRIRQAHQAALQRWIAAEPATTAIQLSTAAQGVVDHMAEQLARDIPDQPGTNAFLHAHRLLWYAKQGIQDTP